MKAQQDGPNGLKFYSYDKAICSGSPDDLRLDLFQFTGQ